jgi:hypothetical protein
VYLDYGRSKKLTPSPLTKPNWPRLVTDTSASRTRRVRGALCAVIGTAAIAVVPASALAAATPAPDPVPGSSKPVVHHTPAPVVHHTPAPVVHKTPVVTSQPVTTNTTPVITPTPSKPAVHHSTAKKKRHHATTHHTRKHVVAQKKTNPVPATPAAQQPSNPVVATAPVATHVIPVASGKLSHDGGGSSSLLAFAALALLVLAGASAYALRFTVRLAQPSRTV